jgi:predicted TPR repeat methyltransferase
MPPMTGAAGDDGWLVAGSSSPREVREYYDRLAREYDATLDRWGYTAPQRAAELLLGALDASGSTTVLDAGCGTGLTGRCLRAAGYGGRLLGVDLSPASLELAAHSAVYDALEEADLQEPLGYPDRSLDGIVCVGVLTYVPDVAEVWGEMCRVVRAGGVIVCTQRDDLWRQRDCERALHALETAQRWTVFHLSTPQPYLPGNDEFGDHINVRFVGARVR